MTLVTNAATRSIDRREVDAPAEGPSRGLRVLIVVVMSLAAFTLFVVSVPGTYFLLFMPLPIAWLVLGVVWLVEAQLYARHAGFRAMLRNGLLMGTAAIVLGTAIAIVADVPLRMRFEASRSSLEEVAAQMALSNAPAVLPDRSIGLFDAEQIERFEGGYRFLVKGTGFLDPAGLAYSPDGPPPDLGGEDSYEAFSGPWWIWVESW